MNKQVHTHIYREREREREGEREGGREREKFPVQMRCHVKRTTGEKRRKKKGL